MKKLLPLLLIIILSSGCTFKEKTEEIVQETADSYNNIVNEAREISDKAKQTKEKVEETLDDLNNAANSVKAAGEAIKEIGE